MLELRPCDFQTAKDFVRLNHRHNKPPAGHKFSIACYDGERLCGVCMVGVRASGDGVFALREGWGTSSVSTFGRSTFHIWGGL